MAIEAAELAKKQAEKAMEVKKAEEKLKRAKDSLEHAIKTDHLVENASYSVKYAAEELARKQQELNRLK